MLDFRRKQVAYPYSLGSRAIGYLLEAGASVPVH